MGIISLINLKKDIKNVFNEENISKLKNFIKDKIVEFVNNKDLLGNEKKAKVVELVINFIIKTFITKNRYVQILIDLLIKFVPNIVQHIYDLLQEYIDGLTEKV